jgi:tetratricopeptide (TPR) repeat protein
MPQIRSDDLVPLDQQSVEDFCRDPFDLQNQSRIQTAIRHFRESNKIESATDFHRDVRSRNNWGKIVFDVALVSKSVDSSIERLKELLSVNGDKKQAYETTVRIRNLYFIKSMIAFLRSDDFVVSGMAIREAAFDYAIRAVDLSRNVFSLETAYRLAIKLSRYELAAGLLSSLIELNPTDANLHVQLADALLYMDRQPEALEQAKRAFTLAPDLESARQALRTCAASPEVVKRVRVSSARWPVSASEFDDLKALVKRHVIGNPLSERWLKHGAAVVTMGSCFAENLAHALRAYNLDVTSFPFGEEVNSTFANRAIFERLSAPPPPPHVPVGDEIDRMIEGSSLRENVARSDLFILTLGVSQGFFNRASGQFFFHATEDRGYLRKVLQENEYRAITVAQNVTNIRYMIDSLRAIRPGLNIVLTVSPVPINRSFIHTSAIQSDCISKSTLRVSAEEVIQAGLPGVHYWPSFEIVRWLSGHMPAGSLPAFGAEDRDTRHVSRHLINMIVELFLETFGDDTVQRLPISPTSP